MRAVPPFLFFAVGCALAAQASDIRADERPRVSAQDGNVAIGGEVTDATINIGMTPEQLRELTKAVGVGPVGSLADKIDDLSDRLHVTRGAALAMLRILDRRDVPLENLPRELVEVAIRFQRLQMQLAARKPQNPFAGSLIEQALAAITAGDFAKAHQLFAQAKQAQIAAAKQARDLAQGALEAEVQQLDAAASSAAEGDLSMIELHYRQAADLFQEAAATVPATYARNQRNFIRKLANTLDCQGDEFGDNSAFAQAIDVYRILLMRMPRSTEPLDWAETELNLGTALWRFGDRESGTDRLEEAVSAYREALEEYTREHAPHDWATIQNHLGDALEELGTRGGEMDRLEEAVSAYRDALKELTRERVPSGWAATQLGLANALEELGERESGTAKLEEAVSAYSEALKENVRERVPLDWATTIGNQGVALMLIAERRNDAVMAKVAADQIEAALAVARDGDASLIAYLEEQLPKARALVARLAEH